uniref:Uncharacterized protein n=1 Tax=Panagrolaimus superbus TaxID=310955 RepID=A0A914Z7J0_9BILA
MRPAEDANETGIEFISPEEAVDQIYLPHQVTALEYDKLNIKSEQIDNFVKNCIQRVHQDVLYLPSSCILNGAELPCLTNVKLLATVLGKDGNVILAVFNLTEKCLWQFYTQSSKYYSEITKLKQIIGQKIGINEFTVQRNRNADKLVNSRELFKSKTDFFNDGIRIIVNIEQLYLTGWVKVIDHFDVAAARQRISDLYKFSTNKESNADIILQAHSGTSAGLSEDLSTDNATRALLEETLEQEIIDTNLSMGGHDLDLYSHNFNYDYNNMNASAQ